MIDRDQIWNILRLSALTSQGYRIGDRCRTDTQIAAPLSPLKYAGLGTNTFEIPGMQKKKKSIGLESSRCIKREFLPLRPQN